VTVDRVRSGTRDVVIRLRKGVAIVGRVVGMGTVTGWLQANGVDVPSRYGYANLDADGTFRLVGLEPGSYRLTLNLNSSEGRAVETAVVDAPSAGVEIRATTYAQVDGRLEGDGDLTGFSIRVGATAPGGGFQEGAKAKADGTFSISRFPVGSRALSAVRGGDDRYALLRDVASGSKDVVLRLATGQTIEGTFVEADGTPVDVAGAWVRAESDAWSATVSLEGAGKFRLRALPPGRYRLTAGVNGSVHAATLDDVAAGTANARLRMP
jgi:hypothetical protein